MRWRGERDKGRGEEPNRTRPMTRWAGGERGRGRRCLHEGWDRRAVSLHPIGSRTLKKRRVAPTAPMLVSNESTESNRAELTMDGITPILLRIPILLLLLQALMDHIRRVLRVRPDLEPAAAEMTLAAEAEDGRREVVADLLLLGVVPHTGPDVSGTGPTPGVPRHLEADNEDVLIDLRKGSVRKNRSTRRGSGRSVSG